MHAVVSTTHSAGRRSIVVLNAEYKIGTQVLVYTEGLDFLVISCQPCNSQHEGSKLEVLSAGSGYLIVTFQPQYSGKLNLFLHHGKVTKESFVFNVEQHLHVDVHAPLRILEHTVVSRTGLGYDSDACSVSAMPSIAPAKHICNRRAVATMISTDDYVTGALVLLWGIINYGQVASSSLICIVTESVSESARKILETAGWEVILVSTIETDSSDVVEEKWRQQFTKLHLFSFIKYSQIIYLDSDTIVKGSLTNAWLCSAPICGAPDVFHPVFFNCGMLVLVPNITEFRMIIKALPNLPAHEGEQSALNEYFLKRFQPLHITLNFQKHRCTCFCSNACQSCDLIAALCAAAWPRTDFECS